MKRENGPAGSASRWWLHHSLSALDTQLQQHGSQLILRSGSALEQLNALIAATGATAVFWNRRYEPESTRRDTAVKTALKERGSRRRAFNASLLFEPWEVTTQAGKPYQVFTPFWKTCLAKEPVAEVARNSPLSRLARFPTELRPPLVLEAAPHILGTRASPSSGTPANREPRLSSKIPDRCNRQLHQGPRYPWNARHITALAASAIRRDRSPPDLGCGPQGVCESPA